MPELKATLTCDKITKGSQRYTDLAAEFDPLSLYLRKSQVKQLGLPVVAEAGTPVGSEVSQIVIEVRPK